MTPELVSTIWTVPDSERQLEKTWILGEITRLGEDSLLKLCQSAAQQRQHAYVPYSHYQVGVAILAKSGQVYLGNNVERVSYSETDHGEEAAITNAVIQGEVEQSGRKFLVALACAHSGDSAPCGRCRQIMAEHADNCLVLVADPKGNVKRVTSLKTLLPYAFTPTHLGIS
ncbi:TPA: cytidine deaminase [Candidatus Collierbacteria bacterium]|nr:cytidine deaminase [Candidatus Collierbacteria bacterium]HBO10511.1 cytidine deaminase [Candidatus Collierbacteria bacterium]